jgi:hypothetical protein
MYGTVLAEKLTNAVQNVKNIDELRTVILQEWQQFPQERLRCLVRSMTVQVQLTVKGKTTPDSYTLIPKSSCAQNVVVLK